MLPQNYLVSRSRDDDDDDEGGGMLRRQVGGVPSRGPHPGSRGMLPPAAAPPLGVTGVLCDTHSLLIRGRGTLQYTVFRPRYVHMKPPLVCLAGGPYLPFSYLSTLVHLVNDRSLIFFDPIGCGQSKRIEEHHDEKEPQQPHSSVATTTATTTTTTTTAKKDEKKSSSSNPIPDMVHDLVHLIQHLHLKHYHLYGHSFGGIVAYEALAQGHMPGKCLSLILSSTPANLPLALQDIEQLKTQLTPEAATATTITEDNDDPEHAVLALFAQRHECRVRPLPLQLQQSFAMAGFSSSPAGWQSVRDYVVQPPDQRLQVPLFLLRGEFDFISAECMDPWWDCVEQQDGNNEGVQREELPSNLRPITTLPNVAHYGMLEDEEGYGTTLRAFLARVPEPALQIPKAPPGPSQRRSRLPR